MEWLAGGQRQRVHFARASPDPPSSSSRNSMNIEHQLDIPSLVSRLEASFMVAVHDPNLAAMFTCRLFSPAKRRVRGDRSATGSSVSKTDRRDIQSRRPCRRFPNPRTLPCRVQDCYTVPAWLQGHSPGSGHTYRGLGQARASRAAIDSTDGRSIVECSRWKFVERTQGIASLCTQPMVPV